MTVVVANRGEVAVRVVRAAQELGRRTVALVTADERDGLAARLASASALLPGEGAAPYLDPGLVTATAREHGGEGPVLLHPGYGFLSERGDLARACADAGLTFVGPDAGLLDLFGDKGSAREAAVAADVPVLPATAVDPDEATLLAFAQEQHPAGVMIKAAGGGGGRGMRAVPAGEDLPAAWTRAASEAARTSGSAALFAERHVARARHVEIQVIGDGRDVMALGDRDCTLQRRFQKAQYLALPERAANHLVRVLRLREGDACVLFNGDGHDYPARLAAIGKREVRVEVLAREPVANESPLRIVLLQGIARGEKMDLILQKATELGVAAVVPVSGDRTEVRLDAERAGKRLAHWRSVLESACEQSGRARVPALGAPATLDAAARAIDGEGLRLVLDPQGEHRLDSLHSPAGGKVWIAIGPEGGWSPRDRTILQAAGFNGLRLGPRVLRTETAGLAAIAALQARFGDL